jgi:cytidine deaminase
MNIKQLISEAFSAQKYSYSPYSSCKVGAALLCTDGKVFKGCNIENAAYSPSNCAERTAVFNAVSQGERSFRAIAVVGNNGEDSYFYPCGVCRQVLAEFCNEDFTVIVAKSVDEYKEYKLSDLLPDSFDKGDVL